MAMDENEKITPTGGGEGPESPGTRFNWQGDERFSIVRRLGSGGMGDVYLARDSKLERLVAIKTIRADLCRDDELRRRIERECLLHAKVGSHTHIVTLYDKLESNGQISLVLEYVEGETLDAFLKRNFQKNVPIRISEALAIATQCLDALSRIHAQGIVHRDIKPANILLARDETGGVCAKLMDFGIARALEESAQITRLTQVGSGGPGTPHYMAPEQIDPRTFGEVTFATDVYAMGIMLFQMIGGQPPFTGSLTEIFNGHLNATPPLLSTATGDEFSDRLNAILQRALAKHAGERYPSAKAFRESLLELATSVTNLTSYTNNLSHTRVAPSPATPVPSSTPRGASASKGGTLLAGAAALDSGRGTRSRRRLVWILAATMLLAAGGGAGWFIMHPGKQGKETTGIPAPPPTPPPVVTPTPMPEAPARMPNLTPTPALTAPPVTAAPTPEAATPPAARLTTAPKGESPYDIILKRRQALMEQGAHSESTAAPDHLTLELKKKAAQPKEKGKETEPAADRPKPRTVKRSTPPGTAEPPDSSDPNDRKKLDTDPARPRWGGAQEPPVDSGGSDVKVIQDSPGPDGPDGNASRRAPEPPPGTDDDIIAAPNRGRGGRSARPSAPPRSAPPPVRDYRASSDLPPSTGEIRAQHNATHLKQAEVKRLWGRSGDLKRNPSFMRGYDLENQAARAIRARDYKRASELFSQANDAYERAKNEVGSKGSN